MKYFPYVLVALLSSALTVFFFAGTTFVGPSRSITPPKFDFSYSDFVSFLLTVLAVLLAALALGIGLVAFRTIGEIKRQATQIAEEHSKSEVERALNEVPQRVNQNVEKAVAELLPKAIDEAVDAAGKAGRLDEALERAIIRISTGGADTDSELQPGFDPQSERENDDA